MMANSSRRRRRQQQVLRAEPLESRYALSIEPIGGAILVNDFTAGEQSTADSPVAVALTEVNQIVVWEGEGATDDSGVYARVYDNQGVAIGESFRVNTTVNGDQYAPAVAAAEDGSFVVVWAGRGVADKDGIFLQRFDATGEMIGEEVVVNTTLGGVQTAPTIAMEANGDFIVGWEGVGTGDSSGVFYRRFDSQGALSDENRANANTTDVQRGVTIAMLEGGDFVIGWESRRENGLDWSVYAQQYNSIGLLVDGVLAIDLGGSIAQTELVLTSAEEGGFVAAWQSLDRDGDGWGVYAREFSSAAVGEATVRLNETTTGNQTTPHLVVAEDGQWIATWVEKLGDGEITTYARTFEADETSSGQLVVGVTSPDGAPVIALFEEEAVIVSSGGDAEDGAGVYSSTYDVTLAPDGEPTPPAIDPIEDGRTEAGVEYSVTVTATDINSRDDLTFELDTSVSPESATIEQIDNNTAIIRWTPEESDVGTVFDFRVVVTDDSDEMFSSSETFSVSVEEIPIALDLNGPEQEGTSETNQFVVGDAAVQSLAPLLTIEGAESGMVSGAVAVLDTAPDGDAELLSVFLADDSPITATYNTETRTLTLTGEATVEQYEEALRTLIYTNSTDYPTGDRLVSITVSDVEDISSAEIVTISIIQPNLVEFAQALTDAGVELYGAAWDEETTEQRNVFQDGASLLSFTDVTNSDRSPNDAAVENDITVYPTWILSDGTRIEGVQTLAALSAYTGVEIPTTDTPSIAEVEESTLLVGSPLAVALDGYDPNGEVLTYEIVSIDNPDVTAELMTENQSVTFTVQNNVDTEGGYYGELTFQLFENYAPETTAQIIELIEADFYDDLSIHRVLDGFAVQTGSPNGDGTGGSTLDDLDDEFVEELQHNQIGLLSMAKGGDDTGNSQFFITDGDNTSSLRNLDYNHTVFGFLTEGEDVLEVISETNVTTNPTSGEVSFPDPTIRISDAEVFTDTENAVLMLTAAEGATGTANITVRVTDSDGNSTEQVITVNIEEDTFDSRPYLTDVPEFTEPQSGEVTFQVSSNDVEGDEVQYFVRTIEGVTATIDDEGNVTVIPDDDFTGVAQVEISVHRAENDITLSSVFEDGDFQVIEIEFT